MKESVLTFRPDGSVAGLYTEIIPLAELGALQIQRLTTIEFNNSIQHWQVKRIAEEETVLFSHPSRQACLDWEHREFNSGNR